MPSNLSFNTIDDVYHKIGYSSKHYKLILMLILTSFLEGTHLAMLSSLSIPLKAFFKQDSSQMAVLALTPFLGSGLGSLLLGQTSRSLGRNGSIKLMLLLVSLPFLSLSLRKGILAFSSSMVLIGFCVSVLNNQVHVLVTESLPSYNRGLVLCLTSVGYPLGQILPTILAFYIMPDYKITGLKAVFRMCFIANFMIALALGICLEESPRVLLISESQDDQDKGFAILSENLRNSDPSIQMNLFDKMRIRANILSANSFSQVSLVSVFQYNKSLSYTLVFLWFITGIINSGPISILSLTIEKQYSQMENKQIVLSQFIVMIYFIPFRLVAGLLNEMQAVGRVKVMLGGYCLLVAAALIWLRSIGNIMIPFFFFSLACPLFNSIKIYTLEAYPTRLRETALGFMNFSERVACVLGQGLIALQPAGSTWPGFLLALAAICSALTLCLPFDTTGRQLDWNRFEVGKERFDPIVDTNGDITTESTLVSDEKESLLS